MLVEPAVAPAAVAAVAAVDPLLHRNRNQVVVNKPPSLHLQHHQNASPPDVTYSHFVNGSILSVPKSLSSSVSSEDSGVGFPRSPPPPPQLVPATATATATAAPKQQQELLPRRKGGAMGAGVSPGEHLVVSVYGFVKYFLRYVTVGEADEIKVRRHSKAFFHSLTHQEKRSVLS